MYIAFLDEFGHIGPYVSRAHQQYNHSPVFGLAGYILPHDSARVFSSWFFKNKCALFSQELQHVRKHPATWEKKGCDFINTKNLTRYKNLQQTLFRMMNQIDFCGGKIVYYGREKYQEPERCNAGGLYTTVMAHTIRNIDRFSSDNGHKFLMILDQHSDRIKLLESSAKTMHGIDPARGLIEPPFQVESHLYHTIQAADWIATIIGRLWAYRVRSQEYQEWDWADKLFSERLDRITTHSTLWRPKGALPLPQRQVIVRPPPAILPVE